MEHRTAWAVAGGAGAAVFVVVLALVVSGASGPMDVDISGGSGFTMRVAEAFAFAGTTSAVLGFALLAAFYLGWKGRPWGVVRVLATPVVVIAATFIMKEIVARERPITALIEVSGHSFPSGHATSGAGLAVLAIYFTVATNQKRPIAIALIAASALWALAQAWGRLVLGVHYASDVVAGLGFGVAVAAFTLLAIDQVEREIARRRRGAGLL